MVKIESAQFVKLWTDRFGSLPENYEITHIDGDHKNNTLQNLSISGLRLLDDTPQAKLRRMAYHFGEEGIYTKENYCYEIADYITLLETKLKEMNSL